MKRKTKTALCIVAVSVAFVSLTSCRKEVPEGQLISTNGIVTDVSTGDPFPGVKVYLFGAHFSFNPDAPSTYSLGPFDSVVTDASGHFSLQYHAEGSSDDYKVTLFNYKQRTDNSFSPYDPAGYNSEAIFDYAYHLPDLHFLVYKTAGLKLHLTIDDLAQDSIYINISSNLSLSNYYYILRGQTIDTVLPGRYIPGKPVSILYRPYSNATSDTLIGGLNYHRELTDTLQLNGSGDVQVEKHIGSTNDFPWHQ